MTDSSVDKCGSQGVEYVCVWCYDIDFCTSLSYISVIHQHNTEAEFWLHTSLWEED